MDYRLDCLGSIPSSALFLPSPQYPDLLQDQQSPFPLHPEGSFPIGKVAGAQNWTYTSIQCLGQEEWSYSSTNPEVLKL